MKSNVRDPVATAGRYPVLVRRHGQFASPLSNRDLFRVVDEALLRLAPDDPETLTQVLFDRSREALGYPDAPTAKQISARLQRSWPNLRVDVATAKNVDRLRDPSQAHFAGNPTPFSERHAYFALRIAESRLGRPPHDSAELQLTLTRAIDADRARWRYGGLLQDLVPNSNQLLRIAGGMESLLALADFELPERRANERGVAIVDAISAFVDATGFLPGLTQIERFARDQGFSLAKRERGKSWNRYLDETRAVRAGQGLPMPTDSYSGKTGPPMGSTTFPSAPPYRPRKRWTEESIIECLAEYLRVLELAGRNAKSSQRDYTARRREHSGWPSTTTLVRYGRFHELLDKARRLPRD
jgi:hypothetical protein